MTYSLLLPLQITQISAEPFPLLPSACFPFPFSPITFPYFTILSTILAEARHNGIPPPGWTLPPTK